MPTFPLQHRHQDLAAHYERKIERIQRETADTPTEPTTTAGQTAPGDTRKLRGIPAIGRGVAGAINGTNPERQATRQNAA